jgi:putative restriction endonuclease
VAYWWVAQNHTFKQERAGGLLWAPKLDKGRKTPFHWKTMTEVQPGDLIFSFVNKGIVALGVAQAKAYEHSRPPEFEVATAAKWMNDGYRVDVDYRDISPPLKIEPLASSLQTLLPSRYSPLTRDGTGTQGYLFHVSPLAGRFLVAQIDAGQHVAGHQPIDAKIESGIASSNLPQTTKTALIECRLGQGQFRKDLIDYWKGRCAATGLGLTTILRASHIKPWRDSNNFERLVVFNGLLLSPTYDALFDQGLISFSASGKLLLSTRLPKKDIDVLQINREVQLSKVAEEHAPYLKYHNEAVFK